MRVFAKYLDELKAHYMCSFHLTVFKKEMRILCCSQRPVRTPVGCIHSELLTSLRFFLASFQA